jgi:hypothetical protein
MTQKSDELRKKLDALGIKRVQSPPGAPTRVMVGGRPAKPAEPQPKPRVPKE